MVQLSPTLCAGVSQQRRIAGSDVCKAHPRELCVEMKVTDRGRLPNSCTWTPVLRRRNCESVLSLTLARFRD